MLLTKPTKKTKKFLRKTIKNLTSFFSGRYQKLPKSPSLNSFTSKNHPEDGLCRDLPYDQWEDHDLDKNTNDTKTIKKQDQEWNEEFEKMSNPAIAPKKKKQEHGEGKKQKVRGGYNEGSNRVSSSRDIDGGGYALAQKMKELDMVDEGDREHVLDVEEALHYYSRLRSPVYLDIVDNFFMDMYSEFSNVPQPSLNISNSKRKGSFRF